MSWLNSIILRAYVTKQKRLRINNRRILILPAALTLLENVLDLDMRSDELYYVGQLPVQLVSLNFSNNALTCVSDWICELRGLRKLVLFKNLISNISEDALNNLTSLELINLNDNYLTTLPSSIYKLKNLKFLSIRRNCITNLPDEICQLSSLKYLYLGYNKLKSLPKNLGCLRNLEVLILHRNYIVQLPESIGDLSSLRFLDVAGNQLRLLPTEFLKLSLQKFYCECNPFIERKPFISILTEDAVSLKELSLRKYLNFMSISLGQTDSFLSSEFGNNFWDNCALCWVCNSIFKNWWLECIRFVCIGFKEKTKQSDDLLLPIRVRMCSYNCLKSVKDCFGLIVE